MSIREKLLKIRADCKDAECKNCKHFRSTCGVDGVSPCHWSDEAIDWLVSELEG